MYNKILVSSVHTTYPPPRDLHLIRPVAKGISELPFQGRDEGMSGGGGEGAGGGVCALEGPEVWTSVGWDLEEGGGPPRGKV